MGILPSSAGNLPSGNLLDGSSTPLFLSLGDDPKTFIGEVTFQPTFFISGPFESLLVQAPAPFNTWNILEAFVPFFPIV